MSAVSTAASTAEVKGWTTLSIRIICGDPNKVAVTVLDHSPSLLGAVITG